MPRNARLLLTVTALLLASGPAAAQDLSEDGCVYNREVYPEGTQMCQSGNLVRCEEGSWSPVGDCPNQPMPSPNTEGGDVDADDEEQ